MLEVVLDDGAVEILLDGFPHPLEALELVGDPRLQIVLGETRRGIARYVQEVRVQVDQVGFEIDQGPDVDGRILVEAVVIRLTELRPEAVGEEQELEQVCELVGGRAAENGHAQRAQRGVFQELPAQPLSLLQDLVDRARLERPVLVAMNLSRRSLQQIGELAVGPTIRVRLERLPGRQHQGDHGPGEVLVETETPNDREERDPVHAELTPREGPDDVEHERDRSQQGRDSPHHVRGVVRAGEPDDPPDADPHDRAHEPGAVDVEAGAVHDRLRSVPRRCSDIAVSSVAMNSW